MRALFCEVTGVDVTCYWQIGGCYPALARSSKAVVCRGFVSIEVQGSFI